MLNTWKSLALHLHNTSILHNTSMFLLVLMLGQGTAYLLVFEWVGFGSRCSFHNKGILILFIILQVNLFCLLTALGCYFLLRSIFAISLFEVLVVQFQPSSIVSDEICTACDFNRPGKNCLRKLEWVWRGEAFMAKKRFIFLVPRLCMGYFRKDCFL